MERQAKGTQNWKPSAWGGSVLRIGLSLLALFSILNTDAELRATSSIMHHSRFQGHVRAKASGRKLGFAYGLAIVSIFLLTAWGCSSGGGVHNAGTPKGTSTLTITGTSGGVNRTLDLTLTVN